MQIMLDFLLIKTEGYVSPAAAGKKKNNMAPQAKKILGGSYDKIKMLGDNIIIQTMQEKRHTLSSIYQFE